MRRPLLQVFTGNLLLILTFAVQAWELSGKTAFENRFFFYNPAFVGQRTNIYYPSLMLSPELRHDFGNENNRVTFEPFLRLDAVDSKRTHWDIRELNLQYKTENWDIKAGVTKIFWGVTESRHLVDIINQSDYLEDIDLEDKLGQPLVNLNLSKSYGNFSLYYMPYFREREFENKAGRFRPIYPIDSQHTQFESASKVWHQDFAIRWSGAFSGWDIGIAQFWGTSREPTLQLNLLNPANPVFIPSYEIINQTSLDLQYTQGAWLWKLEAMTRGGQDKRFQATVAGFEYTLYDLGDSGVDLGLFSEYLYDGRDLIKAPPTLYNNNIFIGMRATFNDVASTEVQAGLIQDLNDAGKFVNLEANRRINENWKVEMKARFIIAAPFNDFVLYSFHRDDYVQIRISRYF